MHELLVKPIFFFLNVVWCFRQNMASVGINGYRTFCARLHIPKDCNMVSL